MTAYIVQHNYYSSTMGHLTEGQVLDLPPDLAAWLLRDSPGIIAEARAPEKPQHDRMVRKESKR